MHKQNGFVTWLLLIPLTIFIAAVGIYVFSQGKKNRYTGPVNPSISKLFTPYYNIADIEKIGPYSTNQATAGYMHNGLDFMTKEDLAPFRSMTSGRITELRVFWDETKANTHPMVSMQYQYNKDTLMNYTFEPFSDDVAVAERQLSLMRVKIGDNIEAGQALGKLIKTSDQTHVHVQITQNNQTYCYINLFTETERAEMLGVAVSAPGFEKKLCYE